MRPVEAKECDGAKSSMVTAELLEEDTAYISPQAEANEKCLTPSPYFESIFQFMN